MLHLLLLLPLHLLLADPPRSRLAVGIRLKDAVELGQEERKDARSDRQRRAEHDADVAHRHLVDVRVLDDLDQVAAERPEQRVVGNGSCDTSLPSSFHPLDAVLQLVDAHKVHVQLARQHARRQLAQEGLEQAGDGMRS